MQQYFWGLEGRKTWPTPHRDKTFLAFAVMAIGEKRFGNEWVGRNGIPCGLQWNWVRDYLVSMCGAGALDTWVLSPNLSEFHQVYAAAWKDKKKTKAIFSRCQFIWPEAHPAYWDTSPVYADIYLDTHQLRGAIDNMATAHAAVGSIDLSGTYISTYLSVMLEIAQEHLPKGKPPPTAEQLAALVAQKLFPTLNPGEVFNAKLPLSDYPKKNGWSPTIARNISTLLRGPERIGEKGRLKKHSTRRP